MKRFWEFRAQEGADEAELLIYGIIGDSEWDDVCSREFADDLKAAGSVKSIRVRINSPGGSVFAGQAIYSSLKRHEARVTVYVDGLAASAASFVAMAGDRVVMPKNALMMIHNPSALTWGDADKLRKDAEMLDKVCETMIAVYMEKTGLAEEDVKELLDDETWMTAQDAVDWGFADEVEGGMKIAASISGEYLLVKSATGEAKLSLAEAKMPEKLKLRISESGAEADAGAKAKPTKTPVKGETKMTLEELAEQEPELLEEIRAEAAGKATEAERERIRAIEEMAVSGFDDLIAKAKFEEPATAEAVAVKIVRAQKVKGEKKLEDIRSDANDLGGVAPGAADTDTGDSGKAEMEEKATAIAKGFRRSKGRSETE